MNDSNVQSSNSEETVGKSRTGTKIMKKVTEVNELSTSIMSINGYWNFLKN